MVISRKYSHILKRGDLVNALVLIYGRIVDAATVYRWSIGRVVRKYSRMLPAGASVLDVGSGGGFYRSSFRSQRYMSLEISKDVRPMIRGDIYALPVRSETLDATVCTDVFEHLTDPHLALTEIWRVLKPNGHFLITVPFFYPMHGLPDCEDYCRWTETGLRRMLTQNGFTVTFTYYLGGLFSALAETLMTSWHGFTAPPRHIRRTIISLPFYLAQSLGRFVLLPVAVVMVFLDGFYYSRRNSPIGYAMITSKTDRCCREKGKKLG
ncbi:class I SAM-dependent methyltransferase [Chloroflexota bacterium]